ncbi:MAG: hypothetical protein ACRCX7_11450 [Cetobacterium sp.]|uniref:hypothetical protein n=1 Tax=Cetobacterium sp. TaxID=2071632 RepID=UPI003F37C61C
MKFKPVTDNSYSGWKLKNLICIEDKWAQLTKGQTYICTDSYINGGCDVRADNGKVYTYNKTVFRLASDLIIDEASEINELKEDIVKLKEEIEALKRENVLLIRINDLEQILGEQTKK